VQALVTTAGGRMPPQLTTDIGARPDLPSMVETHGPWSKPQPPAAG
jgi:hypothetical protein